jgi:hypothetical protein
MIIYVCIQMIIYVCIRCVEKIYLLLCLIKHDGVKTYGDVEVCLNPLPRMGMSNQFQAPATFASWERTQASIGWESARNLVAVPTDVVHMFRNCGLSDDVMLSYRVL